MAIAAVVMLTEDGVPLVGEIDADLINTEDLAEVETMDEALSTIETLILGDAPDPEIEEAAFEEAAAVVPDDEVEEE